MTRLAWITPGYPPDRGGISDHSAAMVNALRGCGHEVLVASQPQERGFDELTSSLNRYAPKALVVAYTPLGFAPRTGGISPAFAFWCAQLRRQRDLATLLLAHEASLPAAYHWQRHELKLALLGAAQVVQFELLARCFDAVAFSNEGTRQIWAARLPHLRDKLHSVRICSNIPMTIEPDPRAALARAGYVTAPRTVLFFGTGHPSVLFDYVEAALAELLQVDANTTLAVVGMDEQKLYRLQPSLARFGSRVQALGYVPERSVSLWLQVADLILAPLIEGVNARKGTVMAAFQHGRAVVTTRGFHTRDDIAWDGICALAPVQRDAFAALAGACFRDGSRRQRLGEAAKAEYEAHASASVTAAEILALVTA